MAIVLLSSVSLAVEEPTRIAVASNFNLPMQSLVAKYQTQHQDSIVLLSASTGKLYAQITHGLPVDAFFAADTVHPQRLEEHNLGSDRFTYALGRLALVSAQPHSVDTQITVLLDNTFRTFALANPRLAPYGQAAKQVLKTLRVWQQMLPKLVYGENIAQTWHFVMSGNADFGMVALSQWLRQAPENATFWLVPSHLHAPIEQQAVVIRPTKAVKRFMRFVQSDIGQQHIMALGYDSPMTSSITP